MENKNDFYLPSNARGEGNQPVFLITQLMQQAKHFRHVDDVFFWLADAMTQRLSIAVVQVWALQTYSTGRSQTELRATASRSLTLPSGVHTNKQVAIVIDQYLHECRGSMPHRIEGIFPAQAYVLAQFNLHYWAGYLLRNEALLPPRQDEPPLGKVATPLNMMISFFTEQKPSPALLRSTNFVLEQVPRIMISNGLLEPAIPPSSTNITGKIPRQQARLTLPDLIPHRIQDIESLQIHNPITSAVIIPQKKVRTLYAAIDGKKNISELARQTHLERQDMLDALRSLIKQHRIQLYSQEGKPVESSRFL